ncbi:MAG: metal-sensitive transcriptional regulator [Candidatus Pacebacteria bacterium]|nr:metal-sensitive transcriptional regulator [Candidatus Paceibacterota bacterium]
MGTRTNQTDSKLTVDITHRLNRASGQIQAVKRMLEEPNHYSCKEVVSQLKAARSALRKVSELYVGSQITKCVSLPEPERSKNIATALEALAID